MEPALGYEGDRYMIYPARDPRVLETVRKIARGLSHHHKLIAPVKDEQVFADIKRWNLPEELAEAFEYRHAERDILQYDFTAFEADVDLHSVWFLRFFERTTFVVIIFTSVESLQRVVETTPPA